MYKLGHIGQSHSDTKTMFNYHVNLQRRHASNVAVFFLGQLIAPVALDEVCAVSSHSRDEPLSSEVSSPILRISFDLHYPKRAPGHSHSAPSNRILSFQA